MSPDGAHLYVANEGTQGVAGAVSEFSIGTGGALTPVAATRCAGQRAIEGGLRAGRLAGTHARDVILGGSGNDRILAGAGADFVCAGTATDRVVGGGGNDRFFGGPGDVDARDRTRGCETVIRRSASTATRSGRG